MSNRGNFIVSLGQVCRWMARKAEALGVELYPGFAACDIKDPTGNITWTAPEGGGGPQYLNM